MTLTSCSEKDYSRIRTFIQINNELFKIITKARLKSTIGKKVQFQGINDLYENYSKIV